MLAVAADGEETGFTDGNEFADAVGSAISDAEHPILERGSNTGPGLGVGAGVNCAVIADRNDGGGRRGDAFEPIGGSEEGTLESAGRRAGDDGSIFAGDDKFTLEERDSAEGVGGVSGLWDPERKIVAGIDLAEFTDLEKDAVGGDHGFDIISMRGWVGPAPVEDVEGVGGQSRSAGEEGGSE